MMTIFAEPKVILFYIGFLPTFVDIQTLQWPSALLVILLIGGITFSAMFGYAILASYARNWLESHHYQQNLNRISAVILWLSAGFLIAGFQ